MPVPDFLPGTIDLLPCIGIQKCPLNAMSPTTGWKLSPTTGWEHWRTSGWRAKPVGQLVIRGEGFRIVVDQAASAGGISRADSERQEAQPDGHERRYGGPLRAVQFR